MLQKIKAYCIFYKLTAGYNLIFSLLAIFLYIRTGSLLVLPEMFWTKVVGFIFIIAIFWYFQNQHLVFYHNLGLRKRDLLIFTVVVDTAIFSFLFLICRVFV